MSLRFRVLWLIGLVLLAGVVLGSAFAGFQARHALNAELSAAMIGGEQTVQSAFEDLPRSDHIPRDLSQLIQTFDGNRHVRAVLIGLDGRRLLVSRMTDRPAAVPSWFAHSLGRPPPAVDIPMPRRVRGFRAVRLEPFAGLDVGAVWAEFSVVVIVLSTSALVGLALVYLAIGAALRPLSEMADAFVRLGSGDYHSRVRVRGPSELTNLEQGFNRMAEQLAAMDSRNRHLESELLTVQEEERADIARDLHDEIGPHLFAVTVDAEVIGQLTAAGDLGRVPERVQSIQQAVSHMQRLVRDILSRLRPTRATELGLNAAVGDLATFWRARYADVAFEIGLLADEDALSEAQKDIVYRLIQEGVSNALRHAHPTAIRISVRHDGARQVVAEVVNDGVAHLERAEKEPGGLGPGLGIGLIGMRERVRSSGGVLTIDKDDHTGGGCSWVVRASLPVHQRELAEP